MRTPVWILNFLKEGTVGPFLDTWWKAYGQNGGKDARPVDRWFHTTDCTGKSFDDIYVEAGQLTLVHNGEQPLIPVFGGLRDNPRLKVVFLGDLTEENTLKHFHFWATKLRKCLLDENQRWTSVPNIQFYGLLLRPGTAAIAPGVSKETRGFLQELYNLMQLDINIVPFHTVAFIEHKDEVKERLAAIEKMNLAILHLSAQDFFANGHQFVDLSASAVFYEASVHNEQGIFLMASTLMKQFANCDDKAFLDREKASDFVKKSTDLLHEFSPEALSSSLKDNCPHPDEKVYSFDLKPDASPWSRHLRKVWDEFYCDFIPNYRKNLVNRVKRELRRFKDSYRDQLFANQKGTADKTAHDLERTVFSIFTDDRYDSPAGLLQAKEILAGFKKEIMRQKKDAEDKDTTPFAIPSEYKAAAKQAEAETHTAKDLSGLISWKIARFPVIVFALVARAIVLGFLLGLLSWLLFENSAPLVRILLTVFLALIPLAVGILQCRANRIRLRTLKKQYVGTMLEECAKDLSSEIRQCLETTYNELLQFCDWLDEHKIEFLRQNLSVLPPPGFSFTETPVLQPLVASGNPVIGETDVLLIPPTDVRADDRVRLSGSFGQYPLLDFSQGIPSQKVIVGGEAKEMNDILANTTLQQKMIRELLRQRVAIIRSVEKDVRFTTQQGDHSFLLLLDVSGSMGGNRIQELKDAVKSLAEKAHVDWIAFNEDVIRCSSDESSIDSLSADGGTNFIPPIRKACEMLRKEFYNQIILISDGCPFEALEDVLSAAYELKQPLNTISIGNEGAAFMKELSDRTSGEQIVVDKVRDIVHWDGQMKPLVTLGQNGKFSFGELVAKCHIPGCAKAVHAFITEKILAETTFDIVSLLERYANPEGMTEWGLFTRKGSTLTQTAIRKRPQLLLGINDAAVDDEGFKKAIHNIGDATPVPTENPLMLATLVSISGQELKEFQWAGLTETCADLNDRSSLQAEMGVSAKFKNLYDRLIR